MRFVYPSIGAIIFSYYNLVDTQLMIEGKHMYAINPEEYVFASLNLYIDIIDLVRGTLLFIYGYYIIYIYIYYIGYGINGTYFG